MTLDKQDNCFVAWMNHDFSMVEYFGECRNRAIALAYEQAYAAKDPKAEVICTDG